MAELNQGSIWYWACARNHLHMATCNHHFSSKVQIAAVSFYMLSFFSVGGKQLNDLYLRRQIIKTPTIIKKKICFGLSY